MQQISVYLNKKASNGALNHWRDHFQKALFRSELSFRTPRHLDELHEQLRKDIDAQVDAIVSVGGDGTMNTMIQDLAGTDIGLLVVPGGTANDLANELNNQSNLREVIQTIRHKDIKKIDLINVNGHFMATNGGIGLGGSVAQKINRLRSQIPAFKRVMKLSGKKIYSLFVAQELLSPKIRRYQLEVESEQFNGKVDSIALLINNQCTLGGDFQVAPGADNTDGKFNVAIFTHPSRRSLIRCILRLLTGDVPIDDPNLIQFETAKLKLKSIDGTKVNFFGDGEVFAPTCEWNISIVPEALKVYTYKGSHACDVLDTDVSLN